MCTFYHISHTSRALRIVDQAAYDNPTVCDEKLMIMEKSTIRGVRIASAASFRMQSAPSAVGKMMEKIKETKTSLLQLVFDCGVGTEARGTIKAARSSICIALKVSRTVTTEP